MKTSTAFVVCLLIVAAVFGYSLVVYPGLPAQVPIHWNAAGKIDQYGAKNTVLILACLPLTSLLLLVVLPLLSPKNFTIDTFRGTFNDIMVIMSAMMGYLSLVIVYATQHPGWDLTKPLLSGIMLFLGLMGNFLGRVQKNFFVGIRTPWTLASDKVWIATHRLAARLMTAGGLIGALCVWLGVPIWACFTVFIALILYPALYSLILYKKLERISEL